MSSSNENILGPRKGTGRKKTKLEKIKNDYNLQVTFSKRRSGLFKKANELSVLCGAEAAIIVYSPGNKVYSYGNPSVDEIARRFAGVQTSQDRNLAEARRKANQDQITQLNQILAQVEIEKNLAKELEKKPRLDIKKMSLEELQRHHDFIVHLEQECDAYIQNGMKFKEYPVPDLNLGKENILQYPNAEGSNRNVPFIRNLFEAAHRRDMLRIGNHPLVQGCSSSNPGRDRPFPYFAGSKRPASHFDDPFYPKVGRSCPTGPYGSCSGGNMEWYKGSSSSDVITYSNACAIDEETISSNKGF